MNQSASAIWAINLFSLLFLAKCGINQLDYKFYDNTCPNLTKIVRYGVWSAIANETRLAASLLRLHFHDCFVNGCEGSILIEDTSDFKGEKNAFPNRNSARGFEVIDTIKENIEKVCPSTVSCTDILTLAVRDAVFLVIIQNYSTLFQETVSFGRRDGLTANETAANTDLPSPFDPLENITAKFVAKGLDVKDMVVLSGGHTIGFAQCITFKQRLFDFDGAGNPDPTLDASLLGSLRSICPNQDDSNTNLAPLDATSNKFDNSYFKSLANNSGILKSDQALMGDNKTATLVLGYSKFPFLFAKDFAASMIKMSSIGILTGRKGEIRKNCRVFN